MVLRVQSSKQGSSYDKACEAVIGAKNMVCLTGAGISCSAGIPDFRSKDGLYALLTRAPTASTSKIQLEDVSNSDNEDDDDDDLLRRSKRMKLATSVKGHELFSANLFRHKETTQLFYIFMSSLYSKCSSVQPTATHRFLKKLSDKNKLLRCYTQNIDGLEGRAGLSYAFDYTQPTSSTPKPKSKKPSVSSSAKVVQLHGTLDAVRCGCGWNGSWTGEMVECMQSGQGPQCPDCKSFADKRKSRGARTVRQVGHYGQLKPNVLLYDDNHPAGTTETILDYSDVDVTKPVDLVLVMGTSLKVPGFCNLVKDFIKQAKSVKSGAPVRAVLVNQTDVCTGEWSQLFDVFIQGDCDSFVQRTTELWKKRRPEDFLSQQRMFALGTKSGKSTVVAASLAKPKPTPSKRNKPTSVSKKLDERAKNSRSSTPDVEMVQDHSAKSSSSSRASLRTKSSSLILVPQSPIKNNKRKRL